MKIEKFRVLLYLKKSSPDKSGKTPIMGRITLNRSMAQFSCKLSCTPDLWNPRESRLNGKSKEAVETNAKIDKLLLAVNAAFDSLVESKQEFDAERVRNPSDSKNHNRTHPFCVRVQNFTDNLLKRCFLSCFSTVYTYPR
jgi:hypothetical protein